MMRKLDDFYMTVAVMAANQSHARRAKNGAVLVRDNNIISFSYNGTPHGHDNNCEMIDLENPGKLITKSEVIHAEINAISKAARIGSSTQNSTMYCTMAPCIECSKSIIQAGITNVYYLFTYRNRDGLELLEQSKINTILYPPELLIEIKQFIDNVGYKS